MRYRELTVENYRVFRGTQTLAFPDGDGVVIVYGENGKGKTGLFNAFRWAWTGVARGRRSNPVPPERLVNKEAVYASGGSPVTCRVRLRFEDGGAEWDLTRSLVWNAGQVSQDVTLTRDGQALTASDTSKTLAEFMPPDIERFFLFDGEVLGQYEALVDDEAGTAGAGLRNSIEQILGVPVVVNAARDMRSLADDASKAIADAAKQASKTRQLGIALEQAQTLQTGHRTNCENEEDLIKELQGRLQVVEESLAQQSSKMEMLGQRKAAEARLTELKTELVDAKTAFSEALSRSWRAVLVEPLATALDELDKKLDEDRVLLVKASFALVLRQRYDENTDACPACANGLDADHRAHLEGQMRGSGDEPLEDLTERVESAAARAKVLRRVADERARADLRAVETTYRRLLLDIEDVEEEISQLTEALSEAPVEELVQLANEQRNLGARVEKARETWLAEEGQYKEVTGTIARLRAQIAALGDGEADPATVEREKLTSRLAELFERAIEAYRSRLREDVQEKASELFRRMRTESDFAKLTINNQYGLRILDSSGNLVDDRSAGYEHLVALSLIGALQVCSPISGPVVMDSPFFRLDPEHTAAVVGNLDELSKQVILMIHEGEIDRPTARRVLLGHLLSEYELDRVNARHTVLKEVRQSG